MTDHEIAHWLWIGSICTIVCARWGWIELQEFLNDRRKRDHHHQSALTSSAADSDRVSTGVHGSQTYREATKLKRLLSKVRAARSALQ